MSIYEDAIDAKGMHFSHRIQRWAIPPQPGISKLLGDQVDERRVDDDDDGQVVVKKKKPRKSKAAPETLGEAMDEDEEEDEVEEEEEEEVVGERKETNRPTRVSPAWSTLYGQYMLSSASHHGALCTTPSYFHKGGADDRLPSKSVRTESLRRIYLFYDYPSVLWSVYE
jgi:hypothetical protein